MDDTLVWYEGSGLSTPNMLYTDEQGSVIATENSSSTSQYVYSPTGEPTNWSGVRFRYTGQAALPEVALYYYKARMYDPVLGRFLQIDPVGYKDDYNLYTYVGNDPTNKTDPTGECVGPLAIPCAVVGWDWVTSAVGGLLAGWWITHGSGDSPQNGNAGKNDIPASDRNVSRGDNGGPEPPKIIPPVIPNGGRGSNNLKPDPNAEGPHSTFRRDANGNVNKTATYEPNSRNPSGHDETQRTDVTGAPHYNKVTGQDVPTPHTQGPDIPGGVRPATPQEIPRPCTLQPGGNVCQ